MSLSSIARIDMYIPRYRGGSEVVATILVLRSSHPMQCERVDVVLGKQYGGHGAGSGSGL